MTQRARQSLPLLLLLLLSLCGPALASTPEASADPPYTVERQRLIHEFKGERPRVVIHNPHGDVRVRTDPQRSLGVAAVIQLIGEEPERPKFEVDNQAEQLSLRIVYPSDAKIGEAGLVNGYRKGRVDLAVFVPKDVPLELHTLDGTVQLRGGGQDVTARTQSGRIEVSTSAAFDLESDSGDVYATQSSGDWTGEARAISSSGQVRVGMPVFGNWSLAVASKKEVRFLTGFHTLPKPQPDEEGWWRAEGRLGEGGGTMRLEAGGPVIVVPILLPEPEAGS